jgi:hypothetical protein
MRGHRAHLQGLMNRSASAAKKEASGKWSERPLAEVPVADPTPWIPLLLLIPNILDHLQICPSPTVLALEQASTPFSVLS